MASLLLLTLLAVVAEAQTTTNSAAAITPAASSSQASGLSQNVGPSFAGFGIEPSNLYSFTGGASANKMAMQFFQNLADYAGGPPQFRIGGNTADYMMYDASYKDFWIQSNPNADGQGAIASNSLTFGASYFEAIDRLPKDSPITFGLNLAYQGPNYVQNIVDEASAVLDNLKNVKVFSFEMGNEPDLYLENGFRTGSWDGAQYVKDFKARAVEVYQQVLDPRGLSSNFFEGPATASSIGTTFTIADLVQDGILQKANGSDESYVATWDQHDYFYFVNVSTQPITLDYLTQLSNTEDQFAYWKAEIASSAQYELPYNLREMQSIGPTGLDGISNVFGAALWQLNFFCFAASLNVTSVGMHLVDVSLASTIQPTDEQSNPPKAFARPTYYAYVAMDQLIGAGNGSLQITATNATNLPNGYQNYVRTYSAYSNDSLMSLVFINGKQANASESSKGTLTFDVHLPNHKGKTLFLSYLTADGADVQNGTTFNGVSFEDASTGGKPKSVGDGKIQSVTVGQDGVASVPVRDSEAVIATLNFALGSEPIHDAGSQPSSSPDSSSASVTLATTVATTAAAAATSSSGAPGASPSSSEAFGRRSGSLSFPLRLALVAVFTYSIMKVFSR
ncbi:MAG: hypothetical protein M1820_003486 [Bogoriella megaspora]|nr:MAG: hypothetical protein M1820_003486 [Bogoriella megaspora]